MYSYCKKNEKSYKHKVITPPITGPLFNAHKLSIFISKMNK